MKRVLWLGLIVWIATVIVSSWSQPVEGGYERRCGTYSDGIAECWWDE